jgi:uncharacterized paraquat-inducible protein A
MKQPSTSRALYVPVITAGIALLLVWTVGAILKGLPMLKDLMIGGTSLSASAIVGMVVTLLMAVILVNFAQEMGRELRKALPHFPQSGAIVASLVYVIAVVIVYNALSPLGELLFEEHFWVYQVGFLALVLVPVWIGGTTLYRNGDKLVDLVTVGVDRAAKEVTAVGAQNASCPECRTLNVPEAKSCVGCGSELVFGEERSESITCPSCGIENDVQSKFCHHCGTELASTDEVESPANDCPECGSDNDADARFCIECGAGLSS